MLVQFHLKLIIRDMNVIIIIVQKDVYLIVEEDVQKNTFILIKIKKIIFVENNINAMNSKRMVLLIERGPPQRPPPVSCYRLTS